jgi:hypothetical protein
VRSGGGEGARDAKADAARRARDQRDSPIELLHHDRSFRYSLYDVCEQA